MTTYTQVPVVLQGVFVAVIYCFQNSEVSRIHFLNAYLQGDISYIKVGHTCAAARNYITSLERHYGRWQEIFKKDEHTSFSSKGKPFIWKCLNV